MKTTALVAGLLFLPTIVAAEKIYESTDYYDGIGTCITEINKDLTTSIYVTCGFKTGNCSGHDLDDGFVCMSGGETGYPTNANKAVNWLLNAIARQ